MNLKVTCNTIFSKYDHQCDFFVSDHQKSPTELLARAVQREEAQCLSDTAGCVSSPNGEGKTTSLVQWSERQG